MTNNISDLQVEIFKEQNLSDKCDKSYNFAAWLSINFVSKFIYP